MRPARSRVLMVSPHFPPDPSAAAHRVRLLAPHLPACGWEPTVVTVDPRDYEGGLDLELAELVPPDLRVITCRAVPAARTRRFGVGDLGLRAFTALRRTARALLAAEAFDAFFVTIYPTYPALLGPMVKRHFGIPFVLDYQDPWVGAWGREVGPGREGRPDWKSRIARAVALRLEPRVVRAADAITAVSAETCEQIRRRYPRVRGTRCAAIVLGGEPADFDHVRRCPRPNPYFDRTDGLVHLCSVGTLLPMGGETLRAVLRAVALLRARRPRLYRCLRLHFFGTSNEARPDAPARVLTVARALGVPDAVAEVAPRIGYLEALTVQTQASGILLMGSSERHYTASRLYPALLAARPILAAYHEESSVVDILRRVARPPVARVVTYDDRRRAESRIEALEAALAALIESPVYDREAVDLEAVGELSARSQAGKLAAVLDEAVVGRAAPRGAPGPGPRA